MTNWAKYWASPKGRAKKEISKRNRYFKKKLQRADLMDRSDKMKARAKTGRYTRPTRKSYERTGRTDENWMRDQGYLVF